MGALVACEVRGDTTGDGGCLASDGIAIQKKNLCEKGRELGYSGILKSYAGSERRGYSIMTQLGGKDVIWRFHCLPGDTEKRRGSR
ncbi:MAG: hypothetical protein QF701_00375 [Nitrospinota bacterium]|nr:hypothetical protein [Nitrospinota bacterium]